MSQLLNLKVRYFQDSTPAEVPCREESFVRRELLFPLPLEKSALLLIDLWNNHFIESWVEREDKIMREVIVPLIATAREAGLTVIHAPCREVAAKHGVPPPPTPPVVRDPDWPPAQFIARQGEYAQFRGPRNQPPGIGVHWDKIYPHLDLSPHIKIEEGDGLVATGQQLHELCAKKGILHLIVAGFATNWCVLGKDYGIRAMAARGYNTILLRDATEGVEFPDTLAQHLATEIAIREAEQVHGFSASVADFTAACTEIRKA